MDNEGKAKGKMKKARRRLAMFMAVMMILSLLPGSTLSVSAAITHEKDWAIYKKNETLPTTQSILLDKLMRDEIFSSRWDQFLESIITQKEGMTTLYWDGDNGKAMTFPRFKEAHQYYIGTSAGDAYTKASEVTIKKIKDDIGSVGNAKKWLDTVNSYAGELTKMGITGPVVAQYENNSFELKDYLTGNVTCNNFFIQLFYDFEIEPIQEEFVPAPFNVGDTLAVLNDNGIKVLDGVGTDSYVVTAENFNDFSNKVSKTYTYSKSTETSTELVSEYTEGWQKETTLSIGMNIPLISKISVEPKVEQKTTFNYSLSKASTTTEKEAVSQSIEDQIQVDLPPHTAIDIAVNTSDTTTEIPYTGMGRISYKTTIIYGLAMANMADSSGSHRGNHYRSGMITFGSDDYDAMEHLNVKIDNGKAGIINEPDRRDDVDYVAFVKKNGFLDSANMLLSGQPKTAYKGKFYYTTKNTVLHPSKVVPLYEAAMFESDVDKVMLYEGQSASANTISVTAENEYAVPYYGFNQRLDGKWIIVDGSGNENSEYASIQQDHNGAPLIIAEKATNGTQLFLQYLPQKDKFEKIASDYQSQKILLTIKEHEAANVKVGGELDSFILDDGPNTTDTSSLEVKIKTGDNMSWVDVPSSKTVDWYTDDAYGITVSKGGNIEFTRPGTYQIYAVVDGSESNRIPLTVLPARGLESLSVTGEMPTLYWNGSPDEFDLDDLDIVGFDGYEDIDLDPSDVDWYVMHDNVAEVANGHTLTAKRPGESFVYAKIGDVRSNHIAFKIMDEPKLSSISIDGDVPIMYFDDSAFKKYDLEELTITASDQYGGDWDDLTELEWKCDHSNAQITGNILKVTEPGEYEVYAQIDDVASNRLSFRFLIRPFEGTIEIRGKLEGLIGSTIDLDSSEGFYAGVFGPDGREVDCQVVWEAQERPDRGISIVNNQLTFTKEGTFHIRAIYENLVSDWVEVKALAAPALKNLTITDNTRPSVLKPILTESTISVDLSRLTLSAVDQNNKKWSNFDGLVWKCDDEGAQIDGTMLKLRAIGEYEIYAQIGDVVSNKLSCIVSPHTFEGTIVATGGLTAYVGSEPIDLDNCETVKAAAWDTTGRQIPLFIVWEARTLDGIKITENKLQFTKPGIYEIRASYGGIYSEWVTVEAIADPVLTRLKITDNTDPSILRQGFSEDPINVDLSSLTVSAQDQYDGDWYALDELEWKCDSQNVQINGSIVEIAKPGTYEIYTQIGSVVSNKLFLVFNGRIGISAMIPETGRMASGGGENTISISGEALADRLLVTAFYGETAVANVYSVGDHTVQIAKLVFPKNTSTVEDVSYTIKVSVDDGLTYLLEPTASVIVNRITGGGGGGGGGAVGGSGSNNDVSGYKITFESNGGSLINNQTVDKNQTVSKPADPKKEGHTFVGWYSDKALTKKYDFSHAVTGSLTLYAKWMATGDDKGGASGTGKETWNNPFTDVEQGVWFYEDVRYAYENGLFQGISPTKFGSDTAMTRAMLVTALWRQAGSPSPNGETVSGTFSDVPAGVYYYDAVNWAEQNGIIQGVSADLFGTDESITRQQMAAILLRYAEWADKEISLVRENVTFTDSVKVSDYSRKAVETLYRAGVINGKSDNLFDPQGGATRAEVAAMLHRFLESIR